MAGLAEIEGNDFNLNISRYVDTTEPVETLSVAEGAGAAAGRPSAAAMRLKPAWTRCWLSWGTVGKMESNWRLRERRGEVCRDGK